MTRRRHIASVVGALVGLASSCSTATHDPSAPADAEQAAISEHRFTIDSSSSRYCSTAEIDDAHRDITRLIVVIHGQQRNGCDYAGFAATAAASAGNASNTLILAPVFAIAPDQGDDDLVRWSQDGWKQGDASSAPDGVDLSSFTVVDELIGEVVHGGEFPALRDVVVVGHSAGGQFVQRYAATTRIDRRSASADLSYTFVVSNPSSYLYLNDTRPPRESGERVTTEDCPGYDRYKYGLDRRNAYAGELGRREIIENYGSRRVVYLLGGEDSDPDASSLDNTCAAQLQGETRLERGLNFYRHLADVYGVEVYAGHTLTVVADTGHVGEAMLTSPEAIAAIFGSTT